MPDNINEKIKEQYDHDNSGGSLNTNLGDFLDSESASGDSINTQWRNWAEGTGTSLNTRLFHKHGGSGSFMTRWKNWIAFSSTHSINLDGSNDYLDISTESGLTESSTIESQGVSLSAWVKFNATSTETAIVGTTVSAGHSHYSGGGLYINFSSSQYKAKMMIYKNGAYVSLVGSTVLSLDTWYHICGVYSGENGDDKMRIYVNGSLDGTSSALGGDLLGGTQKFGYVGRNIRDATPMYFDGLIDEVAIWDVALDSNDITSVYNNGKIIDLSKSASYGTDRTDNLKLWLRCGDKAEPESTTAIARQDFYTDFDGTDDYVQTADLNFTTALSVSAWVNHSSISGDQTYVADWDYPNNGRSFQFRWNDDTTDKLEFMVTGDGSTQKTNSANFTPDINRWYHLVATYNAGTTKIYINGVSQTVTADASQPTSLHSSSDVVLIGATGDTSTRVNYMNGGISSVSLYQTVLDAQTISQMAKSRFTPMRDNRFSVVDFDGSNDYIQLGSDISLTGEFTFNFWYNTTYTGTNYLLGHSTESGFVRTQNTGTRFGIQFNSVSTFTITLSTTLPLDGTWNNITITRDSSDTIKCYLNGSEVGTSSSRSGDFDINRIANYASNQEYNGSMSSASIYNTAKSAEEVYAIYQQGITYDESSLSGLQGYWKMGDDTSASYPTIADSSSNSNDGTITNGASDDMVQQMVGGWDLGSFESSSEELSGEIVQDSSFELSGEQSAGTNGTYYNLDSEVSISNGQLISNATSSTTTTIVGGISVEQGKVYKIEIVVASGSSNANISISNGDNSVATGYIAYSEGSNIVYFTPSATTGLSAFKGANSSRVWTIDSFSFKEVLQSEVSDTFPFIADVNEPVLGVEVNTVANATSPTNETNATTGWESGVYASTVSSVAEGYTGSYSLKVVTSINIGFAQTSSAWTVDNDSTYKLSITWKTEGTNTDEWSYGWGTTQTNGSYGIEYEDGSTDWVTSVKYIKTTSTVLHLYLQEQNSTSNALALYVDSISIKKIQGNVGTMTNQDSADLVYSSVLPDQSFLTGVNSAYNFIDLDGAEYIDAGTGIGNLLGSNYAGDLSISIWFKSDNTNVNDGLFGISSFSNSFGELFIRLWVNKIYFRLNDGNWGVTQSFTDTSDWHHLACIYKAGSESDSNLYLDGSSVGSKDGTFPSTSDIDLNNLKVTIGAFYSSSFPFIGKIGQTAMWNKALSPTEISAINTLGRHSNLLDSYSDNLLGYWAMGALDAKTGLSDVGDGTIYDRSGNSNHGTAINTESADLKSSPNAEPNGYAKGDTNRSTTTP